MRRADVTSPAPCDFTTFTAPTIEPPVEIMSSNNKAVLPRIGPPIRFACCVFIAPSALVDDGQNAPQSFEMLQGPLDAPFIGAHDHDVVARELSPTKYSSRIGAAKR